MTVYRAVRRISHDGVLYGPGTENSLLELNANLAEVYLTDGTLERAASVPRVPQNPPVVSSKLIPPPSILPTAPVETAAADLESEIDAETETDSQEEPDDFRTNLNTATEVELRSLKFIGAATAQKLINARPFLNLEAAKAAAGLREDQWAEIEAVLTV